MKRRTVVTGEVGPLAGVLARALGLSPEGARALVARGAVYVDGKRVADAAREVPAGAKLTAVLEESGRAVAEAPAAPPALEVLYEDADVIAVNKPAGVTAQPTPGRVGESLLDLVSARLGRPAGLVHRLDKETSGVTVFGKSALATSRLAAAFREGRATKRYLAVTGKGLPERGRVALPLSKDPSRPGRWRATHKANGLAAVTDYVRLSDGETCLVELSPQTGRTHQLRAHLAGIGFPIVGDTLYGGAPGPRCLLHAQRLEVDGLVVEAPLPQDFPRPAAPTPRR